MDRTKILHFVIIFFLTCGSLMAGDGTGNKNYKQDYLDRNLSLAKREHDQKAGKVIDFYIDLQLGVGITNADIKSQPGVSNVSSDSKAGFNGAAIFYLDLFDVVKFSSGLDFAGKNFKVNAPVLAGSTDTTVDISNQYLNIPLNFNFGGMITEKLGVTFNGGPYLGFLISTDEKVGLGYKNFDLGLNGTLTADYLVAPFTSVILGTKLQYGGLNNLGSSDIAKSISTLNYGFFTGVRFGL
ncbi:MAG: hypothetical protein UZ04_CHB001000080 [Chlorobi bacterium OLB4]|jgi:hypothetical protein|nr:MAG: hypothetical protein UZ04_CHB001000080 [Chlorobi bacterium OLB4]MBW7856186.1 outer membrane beta-barrel protein [Ignavibacteria bacterium]OQY78000.1 MAG: hypothetical protein B6D43_05665 [Ignavibacteriales bacterium UTCHB1]